MRNDLCILFFLAFITHSGFSQQKGFNLAVVSASEDQVILELTISELNMRKVGPPAQSMLIPTLEGATYFLQAGDPDLLKIAQLIAIPPDKEWAMDINIKEVETIRQVDIAPSHGNLLRSTDPTTVPYIKGDSYSKDDFFPSNWAELNESFYQHGIKGQSLWLQPMRYNPVRKELMVCKSMQVILNAKNSNKADAHADQNTRLLPGGTWDQILNRLYLNYPFIHSGIQTSEMERMLVITTPIHVDNLAPFLEWKRQTGLLVDVVTTDMIGSSQGPEIRDWIKQYYIDNGLDYVLIVGDETQIVPNFRNSGGTLYSCDNCFGYMDDEDHILDVMVGRLHASNANELVIMMNRIIEYEKNPFMENDAIWMVTGMASASQEGKGFGDDGQADYEHANEWKANYLAYGFDTYWEYYDGTHGDESPTPGHPSADQPNDPTNVPMVALMNNPGVSIYNYTGHGWEQGQVSGNFNVQAVNNLRNDGKYPILISVACCTGNFTSTGGDCLGEAWQRSGDLNTGQPWGGIAGFFSSDFQSWSPPMEGQDAMNQFLVDADGVTLFPTIGGMAVYGFTSMIAAYNDGGEVMADFWNPFADPTTVPRNRLPQVLSATHAESLTIGSTQLMVHCAVERARVGLYQNSKTIAFGIVVDSVADLSFSALSSLDDIILTVTQFNYIPYQGNVKILPASGPYVISTFFDLDDIEGNDDGRVEYGEPIRVHVDLKNVGFSSAENVQLVLSATSQWVELITDQHSLTEVLIENDSISLEDVFYFKMSDAIPHNTQIDLILDVIIYDTIVIKSTYSFKAQAPRFEITSYEISDPQPDGNANGRIESNEKVIITYYLLNSGGSISPSINLYQDTDSPWVAFNPYETISELSPGAVVEIHYELIIGPDVPVYTPFELNIDVTGGAYQTLYYTDVHWINPIVEDFETGDFNSFPWDKEADEPWSVVATLPFSGNSCAQSGDIEDNEASILTIELDVLEDGFVKFARRVSCEEGWDFLFFTIDGEVQDSWSGEKPWEVFEYPLSKGQHALEWQYVKDEIISQGDDLAWVDEVYLPLSDGIISSQKKIQGRKNFSVFPNPTKGLTTITLDENYSGMDGGLSLINAQGMIISLPIFGFDNNQIIVDLSHLPDGIYILEIKSGSKIYQGRIVKVN